MNGNNWIFPFAGQPFLHEHGRKGQRTDISGKSSLHFSACASENAGASTPLRTAPLNQMGMDASFHRYSSVHKKHPSFFTTLHDKLDKTTAQRVERSRFGAAVPWSALYIYGETRVIPVASFWRRKTAFWASLLCSLPETAKAQSLILKTAIS